MAVVITWTHEWSSSDDGTVLSGADLQSVQTDIEGHSHTSGIETFLALSDTPSSYTGQASKLLGVNAGASAVEFTDTIGGTKTFSSIPVLPSSDPTSDNQAARKAYVDGKITEAIILAVLGIYDSGWFDISTTGAIPLTKTHNLGTTKLMVTLPGASASDGTDAGLISNKLNESATVIADITTTQYTIKSVGNSLRGFIYKASLGEWKQATYARVILLALE